MTLFLLQQKHPSSSWFKLIDADWESLLNYLSHKEEFCKFLITIKDNRHYLNFKDIHLKIKPLLLDKSNKRRAKGLRFIEDLKRLRRIDKIEEHLKKYVPEFVNKHIKAKESQNIAAKKFDKISREEC